MRKEENQTEVEKAYRAYLEKEELPAARGRFKDAERELARAREAGAGDFLCAAMMRRRDAENILIRNILHYLDI